MYWALYLITYTQEQGKHVQACVANSSSCNHSGYHDVNGSFYIRQEVSDKTVILLSVVAMEHESLIIFILSTTKKTDRQTSRQTLYSFLDIDLNTENGLPENYKFSLIETLYQSSEQMPKVAAEFKRSV